MGEGGTGMRMLRQMALAEFPLHEFSCHCARDHAIKVHPRLAETLFVIKRDLPNPDDLRHNSGHRCARHNATLKGASRNSRHIRGEGDDIEVAGWTPQDFYRWLEEKCKAGDLPYLDRGAIGVYVGCRTFLHIDVRPYRHRFAYRDYERVDLEEVLRDA